MNPRLCIRVLALCAAAVLLAPAQGATTKEQLAEAMSHDGLQKANVKGLDLMYTRPGATLAAYTRVKIDPIEVSFSKNWDPKRPGSNFRISKEDREDIRTGVAKVVLEEFTRELQAKSGYQVVTESGPDVLRVKATIVNLYVNAPDTQSPGVRTYVASAGEMSLVAELFDSETGQVLARVVDRSEARNIGSMTWANSASNAFEARDIAAAWARVLRQSLDKAKGIGKK